MCRLKIRCGAADRFMNDEPQFDAAALEEIINAFDAGVMVADTSGNLLLSNDLAVQMVGAEVSGAAPPNMQSWAPDHGFFFPDQSTRMPLETMPMVRALGGEQVDEETMFLRNPSIPDGVFLDVSARPLKDLRGTQWGAMALFRDVTDRYTVAKALSEAFDTGRQEVLRTVLHNIGNAMNSVAAGLGTIEELVRSNTPLRHLGALTEALQAHQDDLANYLRDDPQGSKAVPFLAALVEDFNALNEQLSKARARVARNVDYIVEVIRSQQRTWYAKTALTDADPSDTLRDAVAVLDQSLSNRNIALKVDCQDAPERIRIDESRFKQMLVNLIKNAIEATDELRRTAGLESPRIDISVRVEDNLLVINVTDNGIGIAADTLPNICVAGYTTKEFGTGLGLYATASYVAAAGGVFEPFSDGIGKGTTISVRMPFHDRADGYGKRGRTEAVRAWK